MIAFVFVLAGLAISMFVPGLRSTVFDLFAAMLAIVVGLLRQLGINTPKWMKKLQKRLKKTKKQAQQFLQVIAALLVVLTLLLVTGIAFHNLTVLVWVAIVGGVMAMALVTPVSILVGVQNSIRSRRGQGHAHAPGLATGLTPAHDPSHRAPLTALERLEDWLGMWALTLFWSAVLMLVLPDVTYGITFTAVGIVILCAFILKIAGRFNWYRKMLVLSTVGILGVIVATALLAPLNHLYMNWRFANMNQQTVLVTTQEIERLEQLKIEYGGLKPSDQKKLEELLNLENRKQMAAEAADAHRSDMVATTVSLPRLRPRTLIERLIVLIVGLMALLKATKETGGHHAA